MTPANRITLDNKGNNCMTAYKLFRKRKDGSIGPLFINRKQVIPINEWLPAEYHPTQGYAVRPGWHVCAKRSAPHLSKKGRVWKKVEVLNYSKFVRPKAQGGIWYLANWMKVIGE
jgi:hypothetical protein